MERVIRVSGEQWSAFMEGLYERDDRLERREAGATYSAEEQVDAYVLSAHAEALQSEEIDGDLWGTLEDIEERAKDEQEAWEKIKAFYLERGCVLVVVSDADKPEEWIFSEELVERLGLDWTKPA